MKPIVVPRMPAASCALAFGLVMAHFALCRPAATSRGYPPIHPFWEEVAPYLAYVAILSIPLFDDQQPTRRRIRNWFVVAACLINGIVLANLSTARAHIGHSAVARGANRFVIDLAHRPLWWPQRGCVRRIRRWVDAPP